MSGKSNDILKKITKMDLYLKKITGENFIDLISNVDEAGKSEWVREYDYNIIKNDDTELIISVSSHIGFNPKSLYELNCEFIIEYKVKESISEDEIKKNINEILSSVNQEISFTNSFITDRMFTGPFVVPPVFDYHKDTKKDN